MRTLVNRLILEKCAQTIEKMIVPDLSSEYVVEQAKSVAMLLRCMAPNIEQISMVLREENQKMKDFLEKTRDTFLKEVLSSQKPETEGLIGYIETALQTAAARPENVEEKNDQLREAVLKTVTGLDSLKEGLPVKVISSLKSEMVDVLRQQVHHEVAWIGNV